MGAGPALLARSLSGVLRARGRPNRGPGARVPGSQQPPGDPQALLQLPLPLGTGVQGVPQLGHQPGEDTPELSTRAASIGPCPLPPSPQRRTHRREQPSGSMETVVSLQDLPPAESPTPSGL